MGCLLVWLAYPDNPFSTPKVPGSALNRFADAPMICSQNQRFHGDRRAGAGRLLTMMNHKGDAAAGSGAATPCDHGAYFQALTSSLRGLSPAAAQLVFAWRRMAL